MLNPKTGLWDRDIQLPEANRFLKGFFFISRSRIRGGRQGWGRDEYPELADTGTCTIRLFAQWVIHEQFQRTQFQVHGKGRCTLWGQTELAMDRTPGAWRSDTQEPDDQQNKEIINHVVLELTTNAQKSWVWALITPELVYRRIVLNPLVIFIQKNNLLLQAIGSCCCVWGLNRNCCGLVGWLVESGNLCVFREDCAKLIPSYSLLF